MSEQNKAEVNPSNVVLDPDFTDAEHREFSKLEAENPYKEIEEEKIRVPKRKEYISNTRHDFLILIIIGIVALVFLLILIFFHPFG